MARSKTKNDKPLTTAQRLGSLLKSARDVMRKDKGLNGDLDRLPMLTWLMFLKFLDDQERNEEAKAILTKKKFRPLLDPPYRWRDWAVGTHRLSGDDIPKFIANEEAKLPDGKKAPGLIPYLRTLRDEKTDPRAEVISSIFA